MQVEMGMKKLKGHHFSTPVRFHSVVYECSNGLTLKILIFAGANFLQFYYSTRNEKDVASKIIGC